MVNSWHEITPEWTIKDIGGFLFKSIAEDLYGPDEVLREYVQNAVDAYTKFQKASGQTPKKSIQVRIDTVNRSLMVLDSGIGMDRKDIFEAKSLAVSPKLQDNEDYVGFRGIGIWAGLAACDRIEVISTKLGTAFRYRLTIRCKDIVDNYTKAIDIGELMKGRFSIEEDDAPVDEHFTYVKLVNVVDSFSRLLSADDMMTYASQNLPVEIRPDWLFADALNNILDRIPHTTNYQLTFNGMPVYREFPSSITAPESEILKDNATNREIAIVWFARTTGAHEIRLPRNTNEVRGFSIRIKNFVIGSRNLHSAQQNLLSWFVGEIYISDDAVKPDTNRTSFNPDANGTSAIHALDQFYIKTAARARAWSEECNALEDCEEAERLAAKIDELVTDQLRSSEITLLASNLEATQVKIARRLKKSGEASTNDKNTIEASEIRKALKKPKVRSALTTAEARIKSAFDKIKDSKHEHVLELVSPETASLTGGLLKKKSNARTTRARGAQVTLDDAINIQVGGSNAATNLSGRKNKVDLDDVLGAVRSAVANVVGENSDNFQRIMQRINVELTSRGLVDAQ